MLLDGKADFGITRLSAYAGVAGLDIAITLPQVKEKYAVFGSELVGGTPEQFAVQIEKDVAKWADVLKRAGIKVD